MRQLPAQAPARSASRATPTPATAPAIPELVHEVLRSPGNAIDAALRRPLEQRFGADFSHVRLHTDAKAAESAQAVGARAYTASGHIVLGAAPGLHSHEGTHLLAHELAHVQQTRGISALPLRISEPAEPAEREADAIAQQVLTGMRPVPASLHTGAAGSLFRMPLDAPRSSSPARTSPPAKPPRTAPRDVIPARGPNPADCLAPICAAAQRAPAPTTDSQANARVDTWESSSLDCLRQGAAASKASHASAIVANEETEIAALATNLRGSLGSGANRYRGFLGRIAEVCSRNTQEVRAQFHYNVVFENPTAAANRWGYGDAAWTSVDTALSALPAEASWTNPKLIRFDRSPCHADDRDAAGQCTGQLNPDGSRGFVGAETDLGQSRVSSFDAGLGSAPYTRSSVLNLPATQQTLRHEVAHVVLTQIPAGERDRFFNEIVRWKDYDWSRLTSPVGRPPEATAVRTALSRELGFDEAQLDAWLLTLRPGAQATVNGRQYVRNGPKLESTDPARMPQGTVFDYARTGHSDYFAELYAIAISRPEFLHDNLPSEQVAWFKRVVFRIPQDPAEWALRLAVRDAPPGLIRKLSRVFTWEQADPIIEAILAAQKPPSSRGNQR